MTILSVQSQEHSSLPSQFFLDQATREKLERVIDDGTPPNTQAAYRSDMRYFWAWSNAIGWTDKPILPVPVDIVAKFIVDHLEGLDSQTEAKMIAEGFKRKKGPHLISTIDRRVSTLASFHKTKNLPSPLSDATIVKLMSKARKASARRGFRPHKKKAVIKTILDQLLDTCAHGTMLDVRDKALLLFGWSSGGRRRSEIVSASMENLEPRDGNFVYYISMSKTDQEGEGSTVPVAGRAAEAMHAWLKMSEISKGPIFRKIDRHGNISDRALCDKSVALIVKKRARMAGLDPKLFAGHSLRSGFLTESGIQGKNLLEAMRLSLHKTMQVAAGYHQSGAALLNETAKLAD